jgi:outer membrane protein
MRLAPFFLALSVSATSSVFASEAILQQADALIRLQSPDKAYDLLAPLEEELSGNPQYDYLLGIALLEKGEPQNAIFAFERCLEVEPKNGPCRVQMARTHLAMGETPNARAELAVIQEYNPPPEVQQVISEYLGLINTLEKQQQRRITAYAQLGTGFDSNINSAPNDAIKTAAALPKIGNAQITPNSIITSNESAYASLNAGSGLVYKVNADVTALADINAQARSFFSDSNFDYQSIDTSLGAGFNLETFTLVTKLQAQKMWLDGQAYRDITGGLAQIQSAVASGQMQLFAQSNQLSYDTQAARDADRTTFGIAYSQAIEANYSPSFYVSVYQGDEDVDSIPAAYLSQNFKGVRVGGGLVLTNALSLNSQLSYEQREHNQGKYPLLGLYRADDESSIAINLNWRINKHLSLQPSYTYNNNQSNIPLSDYTRHVVNIDLRFDL